MDLSKINLQPLYSLGRSAAVVGGTAVSTALAIHAIDGNQAQDFTQEIQQIGTALGQIFTGFQSLTEAGAKLIVGVSVVYGVWKQTLGQKTKDVIAAAPVNAAPIMQAIVEAKPTTRIITDDATAKATPSDKVLSAEKVEIVNK